MVLSDSWARRSPELTSERMADLAFVCLFPAGIF